MPADESREVTVEVPLGGCGIKDVFGTQVHFLKDDGKLVHEGDIQVPLDVLDDLSSLGSLYILGFENVRGDLPIKLGYKLGGLLIYSGNHFGYFVNGVLLISGVYSFGTVGYFEILSGLESRAL